MASFDQFPLEICIEILSYCQEYHRRENLPLKQILDLGLVCKKWHQAIKYIGFDIFLDVKSNNNLYIENIIKLKIRNICIYIEDFQNVQILEKINQVCKNIKKVKLVLDEDVFFENTKLVVNTITNIDTLCLNYQDIFDVENYNDSFFSHNNRIKKLQLASTNINSRELHSLVKKFPNINELLIQDCVSVDSELFEEDMDVFKNIKTLAVTVSKDDCYFDPKDIGYIMANFKGLTQLFFNYGVYG